MTINFSIEATARIFMDIVRQGNITGSMGTEFSYNKTENKFECCNKKKGKIVSFTEEAFLQYLIAGLDAA